MKRINTKLVNYSNTLTNTNMSLKTKDFNCGDLKQNSEYESPKILILKPKKSNKIFCGCWQVANQQDAC